MGNITTRKLQSANGLLDLYTSGSFTLNQRGSLTAGDGPILVNSFAARNGTIQLGSQSVISSIGYGGVEGGIAMGVGLNIPTGTLMLGPIPHINVTLSNGGLVYHMGGLVAVAPANTIKANGAVVEFGVQPNIFGLITIGGCVTMNATTVSSPVVFHTASRSAEAIIDTGDWYDPAASTSMAESPAQY